jgi:hypothetical protein
MKKNSRTISETPSLIIFQYVGKKNVPKPSGPGAPLCSLRKQYF